MGGGAGVPGVDEVGHLAAADGGGNIGRVLGVVPAAAGADALLLEEGGGAGGGLDVEAHAVEPAHQGQRLLQVLLGRCSNQAKLL